MSSWLLNFAAPVFWNDDQKFSLPTRTIHSSDIIGLDLKWVCSLLREDLLAHHSQAIRKLANYPIKPHLSPVQRLFLYPFAMIPESTAYVLMSVLTLASLLSLLFFIVPNLFKQSGDYTFSVIMLICALLSYTLHLELERGQYNLFTVACSWAGLLLFHRNTDFIKKALGLMLVSFAIHLKVWNVFFLPLLFDDVRNYKHIVITISTLTIINLLTVITLGIKDFERFFQACLDFRDLIDRLAPSSLFNHSIFSYSINTNIPYLLYLVILLVCFAFIITHILKNYHGFWNPESLFVFGILSYLLLIYSGEYKLVYLPPLFLILLNNFDISKNTFINFTIGTVSFFIMSVCFSQTLHTVYLRSYFGAFTANSGGYLIGMFCIFSIVVSLNGISTTKNI
jgi:hypothetical protein